MPSTRGARQTAGLLLLTCATMACTLDQSGLDPDAQVPTGGTDTGEDQASPADGGGGDATDLALDESAEAGGGDLAGIDGGVPGPDADSDGGVDLTEAGPPLALVGCADGTREGLLNLTTYPTIAACEGGWQVPGLTTAASQNPACSRSAGNQSAKPDGQGCSIADLCAAGWHVCESAADVLAKGGSCADAITPAQGRKVFYATRQVGDDDCAVKGNGNEGPIHGCGNFAVNDKAGCAPLNGSMHDDNCAANPPWACTANNATEQEIVTKAGPSLGGVLCCKD